VLGIAAALSPPAAGVDLATGLLLTACGGAALARGRGPLLFVAGLAWLAGDAWNVLLYAHRGPLTHVLLGASPVTLLAYVDGLIAPLARSPWPTIALAVAIVAAAAVRFRRRAPVVIAALVAAPLVMEAIGKLAQKDTAALATWWYDLAIATAGVAVVLGMRSRAMETLVIELASEPQALQAALARAVGDPTLQVAYRVGGGWVDEAGRPTHVPAPGGPRTVRVVDDLAALVHDPAVLRDETLARSVDAAVRLALATVRLQADVAARVREVERSRRRLVEAGAAERRRLREQLRTGAEARLAAARAELAQAPVAAPLRAELGAAHDDLRRFAQGIHPRTLTEHGLAAALAELARQAAVRVELTVPPRRFPSPQETVAYFVCAESLTNVAKYAPAASVRIGVSAGPHLLVTVADDGPGGADPAAGSGLRGLVDRVDALGGTLTVSSPSGHGTTVTARVPLPVAEGSAA
jgi:signal transduction histidine kinase